jgi:hypothetical protein
VTISAFSGWRQRQTTGAFNEGEGVITRRAASPGFPQGRRGILALARDTWFDMYPGRAARQSGLWGIISRCVRIRDIPAG